MRRAYAKGFAATPERGDPTPLATAALRFVMGKLTVVTRPISQQNRARGVGILQALFGLVAKAQLPSRIFQGDPAMRGHDLLWARLPGNAQNRVTIYKFAGWHR